MAGKYIITYKDFGTPGELSTVTFNTPDANAGNIAALITDGDVLRVAMQKIMIGGVQKRQLVAFVNETKVEPTNPFAQRETKWLVRYRDASSKNAYSLEIPCADLGKLDPDNSGKALMTDADVIEFKDAFEAYHRSPEGNAAELIEIVHVGRNS